MTFNIYTTNNCSGAIWNTSTNSLSGTSPNGPTAQSNSFGPFTPGVTYYFDATYNGDPNNSSASSPCASEPVTVTKTSPGMYTTLSGTSVNLGGSFSDSATLTSAVSPTGSVTFNVYNNANCTGPVLFTSNGAVQRLHEQRLLGHPAVHEHGYVEWPLGPVGFVRSAEHRWYLLRGGELSR